ncbi:MAG: hypothetical protein PHQ40_12090 [Anaerolineaceae bacterium]|nr:hypothetical protein [Anaerolineaceae bacterium]
MATPCRQMSSTSNISRLITAAVVNQGFRKLLLSNPEKAISTGYNGETFRLDRHEQELVLSVHATCLADFAVKVASEPTSIQRPAAPSRRGSFLL